MRRSLIFFRTQAQTDGTFKAISEMYAEVGVPNLFKAPENNELLGMERILSHWMNLEEQEPTLKIVCPKRFEEIGKPIYRVHNEGCPNLLWELRRARREQLTAVQLLPAIGHSFFVGGIAYAYRRREPLACALYLWRNHRASADHSPVAKSSAHKAPGAAMPSVVCVTCLAPGARYAGFQRRRLSR